MHYRPLQHLPHLSCEQSSSCIESLKCWLEQALGIQSETKLLREHLSSMDAGSLEGAKRAWMEFGQKLAGTCLEELRPPGYFQKGLTRRQIDSDLATFAQCLAEPSTQQQLDQYDGAFIPTAIAFCRLVSALTSKTDTKLHSTTATSVCCTLSHWLHPNLRNSSDRNAAGPQLHTEASSAMSNLFAQHYALISQGQRSSTLSQLTSLLQPLPPVQFEGGWRLMCSSQQRHALQALGAALGTKPANELTEDQAVAVAQSITALLQSITRPGTKLMEDAFHCDFYCTLLRTLNAALLEAKKWWPNNAGVIIDGLSRFMLFGLQPKGLPGPGPAPSLPQDPRQAIATRNEPAGIGPSSAAQQWQGMLGRRSDAGGAAGGAYCPPHRRRRSSQGSASEFSDSDASDSDGQGSDKVRLSKVRLQMLTCLQSMAKTQPKAMHYHWTSILPVYQPLQPRPLSPHLITMLLFDPVSKVRSMAAATVTVVLEGTAQRGFLAVAEAKSVVRPSLRGFTTLSTSLGQLCLSVHTGLLHAVKHEINLPTLTLALRAAGTFMAAAPFERLPDTLLLEAMQAVHSRWQLLKHVANGEDGMTLQSAVLAAMAAAFATKAASPKLKQWLLSSEGVDVDSHSSPALPNSTQPGLLVDELCAGAESANPVLRMEALTALKGLAALYTDVLEGKWQDLIRITRYNLQFTSPPGHPRSSSPSAPQNSSTANTSEDKASHHAIKLIHTFLSAHSPTRQDQEPADADERLPSLSSTTLHASSLSEPCSPMQILPVSVVDDMWRDTCELLLGTALGHVSSMVKAAAFSAWGDIPDSALRALGADSRQRLEAAAAHSATQDPAPAVRSAACKLFGVICEFQQCTEGQPAGRECWQVLRHGLKDPTMSVKVAAAAAVANLSSAYRRCSEEGVLGTREQSESVEAVQQLASLVIAASQGAEKVRCHGVRALGQLLSFTLPEWLDQRGQSAEEASVAVALECLQTGLASSSMKVQWNAAYAAASLLSNHALVTSPVVTPQLPGLLLLLLVLLRDSNNFKIRTHAALALTNADRPTMDRVYHDVMAATLRALEGLHTRISGPTDVGVVSQEQAGVTPGATEGGSDSNFPNYRYTSALQAQLKALLLHLLSIAQPSDQNRLLDIISRRQSLFLATVSELLPSAKASDSPLEAAHAAVFNDTGGASMGAADAVDSPVPSVAAEKGQSIQLADTVHQDTVGFTPAADAVLHVVESIGQPVGVTGEEDVSTTEPVSPAARVQVVRAPSVSKGWQGPPVSERLLRAAAGGGRQEHLPNDPLDDGASHVISAAQDSHHHLVGGTNHDRMCVTDQLGLSTTTAENLPSSMAAGAGAGAGAGTAAHIGAAAVANGAPAEESILCAGSANVLGGDDSGGRGTGARLGSDLAELLALYIATAQLPAASLQGGLT